RIVAHEVGHLIGTEPLHAYAADDSLSAVADTLIPDAVKDELINGLQKLVDLADEIDDLPALQVKIPGIDKSVAELLSLSDTITTKLQTPIVGFLAAHPSATFEDLFAEFPAAIGAV